MTLQDDDGITDENGQATTVAVPNDRSGGEHAVSAQTAGVRVSFAVGSGGASGTSNFGHLNLPATGFAPGLRTPLRAQPPEKTYSGMGEMRLVIPALQVNVALVGVPKKEGGWDLSWLANQAGYLEGTAFPTWNGNSAITGHVYTADGKAGPFVNLNRLKWGDQVIVQAWGQEYVYEVRSVEVVNPGSTRVLGHEEKPWLTLLTCQEYDPQQNLYLKRLAVKAGLIEVR